MRKKNFKGRCEKRVLPKCAEVSVLFPYKENEDIIQYQLDQDDRNREKEYAIFH